MQLKRIPLFYSLILLLLSLPGLAQQAVYDSLLSRLRSHQQNDTNRINLLGALAMQYQYLDIDSMIVLGRLIIKQSEELSYVKGKAEGHKILGVAYYQRSDKYQALYYDSIALHLYEQAGDLKGLGNVYNNIAVLYNQHGLFRTSQMYHEKSLAIREKINDKKGLASSYANISNNLNALGKYAEALPYILKSLTLRKQINDMPGVANSYLNLGNLQFYMANYKDAERCFRIGLDISKRISNHAEMANLYNNIASIFYIKNNIDSADYYFSKALETGIKYKSVEDIIIAKTNLAETALKRGNTNRAYKLVTEAMQLLGPDSRGESHINMQLKLAQIYAASHNYAKAISEALRVYEISQKEHSLPMQMETAQELSSYYELSGNHQAALKYYKLFKTYADSIYNSENSNQFNDLEHRYNLKEKEREIDKLESERKLGEEKNKKLEFGFALLVAVLAGTTIVIAVLYSNRKKQKHINALVTKQKANLEQHNLFKDKVFSILAHDLRSPVASLLNLVNMLESGQITQEEFLAFRKNMVHQIGSLSLLLDNLLNWARNQMKGRIQTSPVLIPLYSLVEQSVDLFNETAMAKHISLINNIPQDLSLTADRDQMDMVFRNLLSNAIKYTPTKGSVRFEANMDNNQLNISIIDTGVGMESTTLEKLFTPEVSSKPGTGGETGTGLGLSLCKEFVTINHGSLSINSVPGTGTTIILTFNL